MAIGKGRESPDPIIFNFGLTFDIFFEVDFDEERTVERCLKKSDCLVGQKARTTHKIPWATIKLLRLFAVPIHDVDTSLSSHDRSPIFQSKTGDGIVGDMPPYNFVFRCSLGDLNLFRDPVVSIFGDQHVSIRQLFGRLGIT